MSLAAHRVARTTGGHLLLDGVTVEVPAGAVLGLLGPNGAGKSTLLRLLAGLLAPTSGIVTLDGDPLGGLPRRAVARRVAVVEQQADTQVDLTVLEVVRLGRVPHRGTWAPETAEDAAAVRDALAATGLTGRAGQRWYTLSGGERQRVHLARALAQRPRELLLDEPTNHLDIAHQLDLLTLVSTLPLTSVVALHDLNLAAMFCDRLVVLADGRVVVAGTPDEVLTEELIAEVYGVRTEVTATPGGPHIRFLGVVKPTGG